MSQICLETHGEDGKFVWLVILNSEREQDWQDCRLDMQAEMRDIAEKKKWCQEEATGWCRAGTLTARYMSEACMKKQTSETAVQYIYRLSSLDVFCFLKKARFFVQIWSWGCFWEVWTSEECLGGQETTWVWLCRDGSKAGCWGSGRQDYIAEGWSILAQCTMCTTHLCSQVRLLDGTLWEGEQEQK